MVKIEKKIIENKPFFYLSEQINIGKKYKKIQVYLGKNIPKNMNSYYEKMKEKEFFLISNYLSSKYRLDKSIEYREYLDIEKSRIDFKYYILWKGKKDLDLFWKKIAVDFIFQSNAIEGSKLSQNEVRNIIEKKYIKKSINKKEIVEVENSIKAFNIIRSSSFKLNQKHIINLHRVLVANLDIRFGYKNKEIIVNNKQTTPPGKVRGELSKLLSSWKKKKGLYPFTVFSDFHRTFESIHPFDDGNGRVGRLIFNWMLIEAGYGPLLIENSKRRSYFESLHQADEGRPRKFYRFCMRAYKKGIIKILNK